MFPQTKRQTESKRKSREGRRAGETLVLRASRAPKIPQAHRKDSCEQSQPQPSTCSQSPRVDVWASAVLREALHSAGSFQSRPRAEPCPPGGGPGPAPRGNAGTGPRNGSQVWTRTRQHSQEAAQDSGQRVQRRMVEGGGPRAASGCRPGVQAQTALVRAAPGMRHQHWALPACRVGPLGLQ